MTALPYNEHRFGGAEPVERDVEPDGYEPASDAEYLERKSDLQRVKGIVTALLILQHHMNKLSEPVRDGLDGCLPNIPYLDIGDDIAGAVAFQKELEAGLKAWEVRP